MNQRTESILNAAIKSFIKTGEPVSSGRLFGEYNFGIKPAMIRHELENLTAMGFLNQPYHSAGRIPSDQGYEFFVDQILSDETEIGVEEIFRRPLIQADWPHFLNLFSNHLGLLAVMEPEQEEKIYKSGLEILLSKLDWENHKRIREIIRDFEELDKKVEGLNENIFESHPIKVFIGRKSPITESEELSVVAEKCSFGGENIILLAIGPKRMNYKKVVKTFKGIKNYARPRK